MIKAVIFDVGGVLVRTEDPAPRARLEARYGLAPGEAEQLVYRGEMGTKAQLGQITSDELWRYVQQRLKLDSAELTVFIADFWGGDVIDQSLISFARSLRSRYRVAIISNAMDNLNSFVAEFDPAGDIFDPVVGSAYEGIMKPEAAIFERTLARLGCQPQEAVFIDDFAHNVAGAQAVGIYGIHFTPRINLPVELAKLAVEI